MKKLIITIIAVFLSSVSLPAMSGKDIMNKSNNLMQPNTAKSTAEMRIHKGGDVTKRKIKLKGIKVGDDNKIILNIVKPFKMTVLTHAFKAGDDHQWIKQTNGKVKRIASNDRSKPFVNSHFFFEDLRPRSIDDYTYVLSGNETVEGFSCYKVETIPKAGKSVYDKVIFYVIKDGNFAYFVVKADIYYKGYLYKQLTNYKIKKVKGIITPYTAVMQRLNKSGKKLGKTELKIKKVKYNSRKVKENMFNRNSL
ncbi:MAG: outer membrane lipoprotein-sorting protein [bacterium]|nr:outer membrane lipoprotein-sorting protein [bacterium]